MPCKPKDIMTFLNNKVIDVAVSFSDTVDSTVCRSLYPPNPRSVRVVVVARSSDPRVTSKNFATPDIKIFTEYPELAQQYTFSNKSQATIIEVHGNTEHFVRDGNADLGIVVTDSGKTIAENNLVVIDTLATPQLRFFFHDEIYHKHPRFFRELANALSQDTIFFYSVDGPNGFMSNFYPCTFTDKEGRQWTSSEHYYQAHKFTDPVLFELIRSQSTAKLCYKTTYQHESNFRPDWLEIKDIIMKEALALKFDQNIDLRRKLMNTGTKTLVEHALKDYHYGCGADGTGKNMLGQQLMELRNKYHS